MGSLSDAPRKSLLINEDEWNYPLEPLQVKSHKPHESLAERKTVLPLANSVQS